jgi:hypothetical protein
MSAPLLQYNGTAGNDVFNGSSKNINQIIPTDVVDHTLIDRTGLDTHLFWMRDDQDVTLNSYRERSEVNASISGELLVESMVQGLISAMATFDVEPGYSGNVESNKIAPLEMVISANSV